MEAINSRRVSLAGPEDDLAIAWLATSILPRSSPQTAVLISDEESINIGWRHLQLVCDVGDRRLPKADVVEQALRCAEDFGVSIVFFTCG
jgi:hypothetical protein